jgi:citrate synthase
MPLSDGTWTTSITEIRPNRIGVRGYDIAELMGNLSFGAAVYLVICGEMPTREVGRLIDAILVSSIDHGATPPSALAARNASSTGASLSAAVASGILAINRFHGGAIEDCARQLAHIVKKCDETGDSLDCVAEAALEEMKKVGRRMSGFGHRVHTSDPRTTRIFDLAREAGVAGEHVEAALAVERVFKAAGRELPVNVDGAIAAVLADLQIPFEAMNGFFMIARTPGLVAHAFEEQTTQKPMRTINPASHAYAGPRPRSLER